VLERRSPSPPARKGSSAMPHKRNPMGLKKITGLRRGWRSNAIAALENIALWHERDISHSSVERIIVPDSTILPTTCLTGLKVLCQNLHVYPERMKANMDRSHGSFNSQRELLLPFLSYKGIGARKRHILWSSETLWRSWSKSELYALLIKIRISQISFRGRDQGDIRSGLLSAQYHFNF